MRALRRVLPALAVIAAMTACSKSDQTDVSSDARDAAHSAHAEASKVASDADMKRTEADLKHMGHVAAQDLRKSAAEAKAATNSVVNDAKHAAQTAGDQQDQKDRGSSSSS